MIVIRNRKMVIPYEDVYIGTSYDTNTEIRMFKVQRYSSNHKDLSALNFRLDLRYNITDQNAADTVMLSKEVHDDYILLKWEITESVLQAPGTAFINLRATENGTNRWSTFIAAVYIGHTLYTPGSYTGSLTEIEQMEADFDHFKQVIEDLEPLVSLTDTAEAWAVGQRNGHDVASSDATYHNNAKYYADNSHFYASNSLSYSIDSQDYSWDAEAWAVGQRNGTDVTLGDSAYHNNAKYYSDNAATSANQSVAMAETAKAWAEGEINDDPVDSSHPTYHNNAKYYAEQASYHSNAALTFSGNANDFSIAAAASASAAANSAENAAASEDNAESYASAAQASDASAATAASNSEAWAVGQRNGTNVGSSDSTYHNNAKYYAEQADAFSNLAGVHKDAAQTAAQQAAASATSAAGSALDASDYADQAAASATAAAASAASLTVDNTLSVTGAAADAKKTGDEIANVKTALEATTGNDFFTFTNGLYVNDNVNVGATVNLVPVEGTERNNFVVVDALAGDKFVLNGVGGNAGRLWAFIDSENKLISKAQNGESATNLVITAPKNTAKLILNVLDNPGICCRNEYATDRINQISRYNRYFSLDYTANFTQIDCYIPLGNSVTVTTIDGENFTGGGIFFVDANGTTKSYSLNAKWSSREITIPIETVKTYVAGESTPSNIRLEGVFDYKNMRSVVQTLGSTFATISGISGITYDPSLYALNIGAGSIILQYAGKQVAFNHATIMTQLGSIAAEDAAGNLIITIGAEKWLIYDTDTETLKAVTFTNISPDHQIGLFMTRYNGPTGGLLSDAVNSTFSMCRMDITNERLINSAPSFSNGVNAEVLGRYEQNVADAGDESEFFLFFSDPHCMGDGNNSNLATMMATIQKAYNSTSAEYVICGGDWLTNSDSFANACYKLGYIKGIGKSVLGGDNFYNLIGNHDTNYQGAQTLTESQLRNLWYGGGKCYYKIDKENCTYFAFDTGLDNDDTLNAYRVEQLKWVCNELLTGSAAHYVMLLHIVFNNPNDTTSISAMGEELGNIITAYNGRSTYTIDGDTFDFSQKTGRVCFTLCGHLHSDLNSTLGGVPLIAITNTAKNGNGTATFDLCVADFTNEVIKMTRIGYGSDREFSFATT